MSIVQHSFLLSIRVSIWGLSGFRPGFIWLSIRKELILLRCRVENLERRKRMSETESAGNIECQKHRVPEAENDGSIEC